MKTIIACGALALDVQRIARRRGWQLNVMPVPALLHNRPEMIPAAVEDLLGEHDVAGVAYGDCGTLGALDEVLDRAGVARLDGEHCYDVFARDDVREAMLEEPGT